MSFSAGTAWIDLTLGSTAAVKGSMMAEGEMAASGFAGKFTSGLFGTLKGLAGPLIGIMALDKLFEFVKGGAQDWAALQASIRQTNAVLTSTGGAANVSADAITALTGTLSKKTATDQAVIRSGENMLLTFTNVKNGVGAGNDIFNQATATMLDMSKALGQDTKNSAIQLGKALNDPVKGVTALQRVGVTFTAQQKDQIKTMVASNNTLGAQKLILAELNKEFGGSAAAAATGGAKLSLTMRDLAMNLFGLIAPIKTIGITFSTWLITPIADGVAKLLPIQQKWVADWKSTFKQAKEAAQNPLADFPKVGNTLEEVARTVGVVVGNIHQQLVALREAWTLVLGGFLGTGAISYTSHELNAFAERLYNVGAAARNMWNLVKPVFEEWGPAIGKALLAGLSLMVLVTVFQAVGKAALLMSGNVLKAMASMVELFTKNPILLIVAAIAGALVLLWQMSPKFREFASKLFDAFMPVAEQLMPMLSQAFKIAMDVISTVLSIIIPLVEPLLSLLELGVHVISDFVKGGGIASSGGGFVDWLINAFNVVKGIFDGAVSWISGAAQGIGDWLNYMFSPLAPLLPKIKTVLDQIEYGFDKIWHFVLQPFFEWLGPIVGATFSAIWQVLQPILTTIGALFGVVFGFIWDVVSAVFGLITVIVRSAMEIISGIIGLFLDIITGNWNGVWDDLAMIAKGFVDLFFGIIQFGLNLVKAIFTAVLGVIIAVVQGAWNFIVGNFTAALTLINSVVGGGLDKVISWFKGLGSSVSNAIGDLGQLLLHAGEAIINGLLDGLKNAWKAVTDFVGGIASWIADHKGPISYDKTLLTPHGTAIMQSLLAGLQSQESTILGWLSSFTDNIAVSGLNLGAPKLSGAAGSLSGAGAASSGVYNVYGNDDPLSTAMAIDRIQTNNARVS